MLREVWTCSCWSHFQAESSRKREHGTLPILRGQVHASLDESSCLLSVPRSVSWNSYLGHRRGRYRDEWDSVVVAGLATQLNLTVPCR